MTNSFKDLIISGKTVFKTVDLAILWHISNKDYLKSKIYYWFKRSKLKRLSSGIYSLNNNYNKYELV